MEPAPVIDPYTIDRSVERYRKGKRNLEAVCKEYGVLLESAHDATSDALAAARLAAAIAERHPKLAAFGPAELHRRQVVWYAEWAADFQKFLRKKGETEAVVDGLWPLREQVSPTGV
jgi:DNA polymerase-3 subunit epsilon